MMRSIQRVVIAFLGAGCVMAALAAPGGSLIDFGIWMRAIDRLSVSVQKRIEKGEVDAARKDAQRLEELYALMETFYRQPGRPAEAAEISRQGKEFAAQVQQDIDAGQLEAAAQNALTIARACNDCHDPYKPVR